MTNTIPKLYDKHPFIQSQGEPWISDMKSRVLDYIEKMESIIKTEAEAEGLPQLADDDFLYERFKDNCGYNMYASNWQVFKFFLAKFKVKVAKEMIADWCYTYHDVEMYEYFNFTTFNKTNKCEIRFIRFKTQDTHVVPQVYTINNLYHPFRTSDGIDPTIEWTANRNATTTILDKYRTILDCVDNVVKNVTLKGVKWNDHNMFGGILNTSIPKEYDEHSKYGDIGYKTSLYRY